MKMKNEKSNNGKWKEEKIKRFKRQTKKIKNK